MNNLKVAVMKTVWHWHQTNRSLKQSGDSRNRPTGDSRNRPTHIRTTDLGHRSKGSEEDMDIIFNR